MLSSFLFRTKNTATVSPAMPIPAPPPPPPALRPPLGLKTIADASLDSPRKANCVKRSFFTAAAPRNAECKETEEEEEEKEDRKEADQEEEEEEEEEDDSVCWARYGRDSRRFPPPMLLSRVLKRVYEAGGRLVIREVRVDHQQHLRARRRNGRLTLQLVELVGVHRGGGEVEKCEKVGSGMSAPATMSCSESVFGKEVAFEEGRRLQLPVSRMRMVVQN
ncbi:double-strand break repair protein mus-23-like [Zingiber officinale]|uniref:FAF domain-containing protein n=1 Tax=Zingiber officinale TaxID=94328 RepID=A0A8J5M7W7_ZINOF|nr:double-strand break repair protein mus-23-like [Zingiber officinale]KAG6535697.1 hypothetical protein ZIOFF_000720 [Zingiber officinale]